MSLPTTLLIDDEQLVLDVLSKILSGNGIEHVCAKSADEGILILKERPIDLVVTDIRMPGLSGLDLLVQIQHYWPDTRRIILTGDLSVEGKVDSIVESYLAHDVLWKPCRADTFYQSVQAQLDLVEAAESIGSA